MHPNIIVRTKKVKIEDVTIDDLRYLSSSSFAMWTQTSGVRADGNLIDFTDHRYLLPIYMSDAQETIVRKAAQLGLTVWSLLKIIYWLIQHPGRKAAYYGPTQEMIDNTSKDRLGPLLMSIPELKGKIDPRDKLGLRKIGDSSLYCMALGGVASKDSVPLDLIAIDEVRLCKAQDIDQVLERISHSPFKVKLMYSTCGMAGDSIDRRFQGGTQHAWVCRCFCSEGVDLARTFPDCVVDDKKRNKLYLRCPKCRAVIQDTQNGYYRCENPSASYTSFGVSQLASKFISLKEIWDFFHRTTNKAEFYNAKLGLPWTDEDARGVTKDALESCVDKTLEWSKPKDKMPPTAMGVDVGGGYCYAVIADLTDSKKRIRHVEIIESENPQYMVGGRRVTPFRRLRELMKEYNVQLCVIDAMPNYDMVLEFCQDFPGRVFAAFFTPGSKDAVTWSDRPKTKVTIRKSGPLLKFKYYCALSRFLVMDIALGCWNKQQVICPDPDKLTQWCLDEKTKILTLEPIMYRYFDMLTRPVKQFHVTNEETQEGKNIWVYAGGAFTGHAGDPHGSFAWLYCNIALERMRRSISFSFA